MQLSFIFMFLLFHRFLLCLRLFWNREDYFVAVFVLVLFNLLLRQRGKIILFKTGNKKCAADNVIRHTVIIGQGAVPRQAQQLALVISDVMLFTT